MHTQTYPHKHTYLPTPNNYLHTNTYLHTLSYLHKHFKKPFQHTPFNTYTHLHTHTSTYMILHTNSVRRPSGRADEINLTNAAALNPFQKICYKVLFRNVAPSRGPRLCRPFLNILNVFMSLKLIATDSFKCWFILCTEKEHWDIFYNLCDSKEGCNIFWLPGGNVETTGSQRKNKNLHEDKLGF